MMASSKVFVLPFIFLSDVKSGDLCFVSVISVDVTLPCSVIFVDVRCSVVVQRMSCALTGRLMVSTSSLRMR